MHELPLITTIASGFFAAWLCGLLTHRLGLSPIVGYLLGGILLSPHTPGFVGDIAIAQQLAEVGVILLMFGVGLHFHLKDLLAVKWIAVPGAVGQSLVATLAGLAIFTALGLEPSAALVLGMAMAVASTVVLIRILQDNGKLESPAGHAAIGWLIVEDIFTVMALVVLPVLGAQSAAESAAEATGLGFWIALAVAFLKLGILTAIVLFAGAKIVPHVMVRVARLRSRELFTLTVLVLSVAVAAASYSFFGASMALGAFLGGMVVGQSPVSHQAASDALPLRDAFAVLFFVSVGMLFEPSAVTQEPLMILAALSIALIAKPIAAIAIVALLGHSFHTGLIVALGLAQIGEFSFILSELARHEGLIPDVAHSVLVATAIITISINPMVFRLRHPIELFARRRPWLWRLLNGGAERQLERRNVEAAARIAAIPVEEKRKRTAVIIGYGFVGQGVCRLLRKAGVHTVIIDTNMDTVAKLNDDAEEGRVAIFGDAQSASVLEQAGVADAKYLLVTMARSSSPVAVIAQARNLNPDLRIFVRSRYIGDREALEQAGADIAAFEEAEVAIAMGRLVLDELGAPEDEVQREITRIREAVDGSESINAG